MDGLWTSERIIALAPDASSAKSGKELANLRKWVMLGRGEGVIWGECQGSAKDPYRTQVDLSEPAFKCSCPSRKFPCKHGLGLLLLLASSEASFKPSAAPQWVSDWLATRAAKAEQKAKKKEEAAAAPVDPEAAAKRVEAREKKVKAGLAELEIWLGDLIRRGLANVQSEGYAPWEKIAARMIDAQAPGLARLLREAGGIGASGQDWQSRLVESVGRMQLLIEGYQRLDSLPQSARDEIRALIGWSQNQDELLTQPGINDVWLVVGQRVDEEDRLRAQQTWLIGQQSRRAARVLQFAHAAQPFPVLLAPGAAIQAEVVFFPAAAPLRALVKPDTRGRVDLITTLPGHDSFSAAANHFTGILATAPWIDRWPVALNRVIPIRTDSGWAVDDCAGKRLCLSCSEMTACALLAISGGHPVDLFAEFDGREFRPLSAVGAGEFLKC